MKRRKTASEANVSVTIFAASDGKRKEKKDGRENNGKKWSIDDIGLGLRLRVVDKTRP